MCYIFLYTCSHYVRSDGYIRLTSIYIHQVNIAIRGLIISDSLIAMVITVTKYMIAYGVISYSILYKYG